MASFLCDPRLSEADILVVLEPWKNPFQAVTHRPVKLHSHLTYWGDKDTRMYVCVWTDN
jgi:hypothetical protein